jgi:outer membrane protein assembly factor BamB
MLPALFNTNRNFIPSHKKSFEENLCEGYHFEIKNGIKSAGARSVYYYKTEHSLLVSHVYSNRVHVLNLETGKLRWFDHHGTTVRSVQVCSHEIITASWDGTVCITGFDRLELRLVLTEKDMGRCPYAAISPDNNFVYAYSYDSDKNPLHTSNTVRKWSLADGKLEKVLQLPGIHLSGRRCGSCEVNDNRLFVVSDTGHLNIYDCSMGSLIAEFNYSDQLQCLSLLKGFDMVAMAGGEGNIYLCDLSGQRIIQKRKGHQHDVAHLYVLPDKPEIMVSVGFDGAMKIWKLPDLQLLESIDVSRNRLWTVCAINDLLISGGEDGDIWIYDIKNLPNVVPKGKLVFSDESYAFLQYNSNSFFASDQSMMQVSRNIDKIPIDDQFAEYLLTTACNFKIFKDLFGSGSHDSSDPINDSRGFYQITQ